MKNLFIALPLCLILGSVAVADKINLKNRNDATTALSKSDYISKMDSQIKDWEDKIRQLKIDRAALTGTSDRYQILSNAISDMEKSMANAKGVLQDLKGKLTADWSNDKARIDSSLFDVKARYDSIMAE